MPRRLSPALAAALLALGGHALPAAAEAAPTIAIVQGLAEGDMLNLRATASPVGKVETRFPNGAPLKKFGCNLVDGYEWCEVEDAGNPSLRGWVPARYLYDAGPADDLAVSAAPADTAEDMQGNPAVGTVPSAGGGAKMEVPPNLSARLDASQPASAADEKSAEAVRKAMQEAYAAVPAPGEAAASPPDETGEGTAGNTGDGGETVADVPVPTPRPDRGGATTDAETRMARTQEPGQPATAGDTASVTGEIPCARYVGQPMTRCAAAVTRKGADEAEVTVTWPDGGTRTIDFRDGKPAGSNARGEFRFTREGTLNMIRIGPSERFEIVDALAFGD